MVVLGGGKILDLEDHLAKELGKEMGPSVALSPAKQAEQLKKDGNVCFKKDRFRAAIDAYTEVFFHI